MGTFTRIDSPHTTRQMAVEVEPDRDVISIVVSGELDVATGPALDAALRDVREAGFDRLRLDLRGLTFLDGHGATQLRRWRELSALEGFALTIELPTGPARRVIDLTGLISEL